MMRLRWILPALLLALTTTAAHADHVTTFEDLGLSANSYQNNAGASGQFVSGGNSFNNSYDATYGAWSGWSISNLTNPSTFPNPDYTYLYNAYPGSGSHSPTYAVADTFGDSTTDNTHPNSSIVNLAAGYGAVSIDVANTTYDYLSMKNGDAYSKQFEAGDYFRLTIEGYSGLSGSGTKIGEIDFNLATGTNIMADWETVNLAALKGAASLVFGLKSSDNDPTYGMNTPALFAADNLVTHLRSVPEPAGWMLFASGCGILGLIGRSRTKRGVGCDLIDGCGEETR